MAEKPTYEELEDRLAKAEEELEVRLAKAENETKELHTLYSAVTTIESNLPLEHTLESVATQITNTLDSTGCAILLKNREQNKFEILFEYHKFWPDVVDKKGKIYDFKSYDQILQTLKTEQSLLIRTNDPKADKAYVALMKETGIFTSLLIPLKINKQVLGFCEIYDDVKPRGFTAREIRVAESLISKAAIALENAHLYKDAQNEIVKRKRTEEELEKLVTKLEATLVEVNVLKGFIPICASCKKIRDDSGYWEQIELYIQKHSEAEFSHSVCPECSDELYGKESWYIKMKEKKQTE